MSLPSPAFLRRAPRLARLLTLSLVAALASLVGAPPSALLAAVQVTKLVYDPDEIVAGVPVTFTGAGSFSPPKDDNEHEEPWVAFDWNFGDATAVVLGGPHFGGGAQTEEVTHTYTKSGEFTVTLVAHHGFKQVGYKYAKSHSIKVRVQCAGSDPGPAKCPTPAFDVFSGKWKSANLTGATNAELVMTQLGRRLTGALSYTGQGGKPVVVTFSGKPKFRRQPFEAIGFTDLKASGPDGKIVRVLLDLHAAYDSNFAYRRIVANLYDLPELGTAPGSASVIADFDIDTFDSKVAALCTSIAAGKRKVKPGEKLAFTAVFQDGGPAAIPSGRYHLNVEVVGGRILPPALVDNTTDNQLQSTTAEFTIGALGPGSASRSATARIYLAIQPDAGATEVKFTVWLNDFEGPHDPWITPQVPPTRTLCVPVIAAE